MGIWLDRPGLGKGSRTEQFLLYTLGPFSSIIHANCGAQAMLALVPFQIKVKSILQIFIDALQLLIQTLLTQMGKT